MRFIKCSTSFMNRSFEREKVKRWFLHEAVGWEEEGEAIPAGDLRGKKTF